MKIKIQIKSIFGKVLFELEKENNTIKETLLEAIKQSADLRSANLESANLESANLCNADLRSANLISANLISANLISANLESANLISANLRSADLRSANLISANIESANNIELAYMPIYAIWSVGIKGELLKIGCKEKTFEEWKEWFENSTEEFSTKRDSEAFKRIHATFLAHKAYYEFLNQK